MIYLKSQKSFKITKMTNRLYYTVLEHPKQLKDKLKRFFTYV